MTQEQRQAPAWDSWAEHYDLTDADRAPFVAFYRSLLGARTRSLLELGCGTGTVLIALARELQARGGGAPRVVGVDESPEMLRVARAREPRAEWLVGDMCTPPVAGSFDLVISCFNTLQFLLRDEDLAQALGAARRLLASGGALAFDVYRPNPDYLASPHVDRLARSVAAPDGRRLEIRETTSYDDAARVLTIDWRLVETGCADATPIARTRYRMRQWLPEDLDRLLAGAGLAVRERYGDFDRSPFDPEAKRQVLVCTAR